MTTTSKNTESSSRRSKASCIVDSCRVFTVQCSFVYHLMQKDNLHTQTQRVKRGVQVVRHQSWSCRVTGSIANQLPLLLFWLKFLLCSFFFFFFLFFVCLLSQVPTLCYCQTHEGQRKKVLCALYRPNMCRCSCFHPSIPFSTLCLPLVFGWCVSVGERERERESNFSTDCCLFLNMLLASTQAEADAGI